MHTDVTSVLYRHSQYVLMVLTALLVMYIGQTRTAGTDLQYTLYLVTLIFLNNANLYLYPRFYTCINLLVSLKWLCRHGSYIKSFFFKLPLNTSWSHLTCLLIYVYTGICLSNEDGYDFYWLIRYVCADSEYNYKWYSLTKAITQYRRLER